MTAPAASAEMLVLGRDSRGMTQPDLARKSGLSQGYISKAENELLTVAGERLEAIARALEYPVEFFVQSEHAEGVEALFHRKLRSMPAGQLRQVQAQINIMRVQVKRLMRGVEIRAPYPFPRLDVDDVGSPRGSGSTHPTRMATPSRTDHKPRAHDRVRRRHCCAGQLRYHEGLSRRAMADG